jgi:hypothetical protein
MMVTNGGNMDRKLLREIQIQGKKKIILILDSTFVLFLDICSAF